MWEGYGGPSSYALRVAELPRSPASSNAHCHAFQRALRGRTEGGDFWAWRETMLELARGQTPGHVRTSYVDVYRELRAAGYTAVGEFHYLGLAEARAAAEAAAEAGIELVLLHVAYARGGIDRFRQESVAAYLQRARGAARPPGSGSASPPTPSAPARATGSRSSGGYAAEHELPLHVHADEQPREIEECLAEHGVRPIELLDACGCLGPRTTVVHATHADGHELDLLAAAGARVCACPTTEANLGDGFLPVERLLHRGIELCIGSDSNVRIDPLEELRELDGIARRQSGRRDVFSVDELLAIGSDERRERARARVVAGRGRRRGPPAARGGRGLAERARRRLLGRRAPNPSLSSGSPLPEEALSGRAPLHARFGRGRGTWSTPEEERTFRCGP